MQPGAVATLYGFAAIVMWSSTVSFIRSASEGLGPLAAGALICLAAGLPGLLRKKSVLTGQKPSRTGVVICGALFIFYNMIYPQAVGLCTSREQSVEISIVQYSWPCLMLLLAPFLLGRRLSPLLLPGALLCFAGVFWCISGENGFDLAATFGNIVSHPAPYILALGAATAWGSYCICSRKYAGAGEYIPVYLLLAGAGLGLQMLVAGEPMPAPGLLPALSAITLGLLYAVSFFFWDTGMRRGNFVLLAALAYFSPVLSSLLACFVFGLTLPGSFWLGTGMVVAGSLLCWRFAGNA